MASPGEYLAPDIELRINTDGILKVAMLANMMW
jgi:hypothetical protein